MRFVPVLALTLFASLPAAAASVPIDVPLPLAEGSLEDRAAAFFASDAWRAQDPSLEQASALQVRARRFRNATLLRATPSLGGVPVEGADRLIVLRAGQVVSGRTGAALTPTGSFVISAEEAVAAATARVPDHLFVDPTVERLGGFAKRVWLARGDVVVPSWRVRVPTHTLRALSDVWVDATTGRVLKRTPVARFADGGVTDGGTDGGVDSGPEDAGAQDAGFDAGVDAGTDSGTQDAGTDSGAQDAGADSGTQDAGFDAGFDSGPLPAAPTAAKVFQYAPTPANGPVATDLVDVDLTSLRDAREGDYLKGHYVETFNCCKEYVCLDGSNECELEGRRCARADDADPILSELPMVIPTEQFRDQLPILPEVLYAKSVFCSELPRVRSGADGWVETPVDTLREDNDLAGRASEEDAFAEVQAYYTTMLFFEHMRTVMGDDTWCLGGNSMQCEADGSPTLGTDGKPVRPFHVAVNSLIPEVNFEDLATQLFAGRGASAGDPLIISDYQRIDNAAFVPANSGAPIDVPPELSDILDVFNREYDSNIYFQGVADFAYDGDIVFHEFTHAVVYSFVPTLGSLWRDKWGANAQPGALNEGWADYFSMSFTGDPVTAEYGGQGIVEGELGLRDSSAGKNCPDDITGEVHDDSIPWSSALWTIREAVIAAEGATANNELDNLLLLAMAQAEDNESFEQAAARVVLEIEGEFGAALGAAAETAFADHGVTGCDRVHTLTEVDEDGELVVHEREVMFLNGPNDIGVSNMSPSTMQFSIDIPANATSLGLRWRQQNGGIGQFTQTGDRAVPRVLLQEIAGPIEWRYEGPQFDTALPFNSAGQPLTFDPLDADNNAIVSEPNNNGISIGNFDITLESDPCNARTFWLQFVSVQETVRITNLEVVTDAADEACSTGEGEGEGEGEPPPCECTATADGDSAPFGVLALLGVVALLRRRRR